MMTAPIDFLNSRNSNNKIICLRDLSKWNRFAFISAEIVSALQPNNSTRSAFCRFSGSATKWFATENTLVSPVLGCSTRDRQLLRSGPQPPKIMAKGTAFQISAICRGAGVSRIQCDLLYKHCFRMLSYAFLLDSSAKTQRNPLLAQKRTKPPQRVWGSRQSSAGLSNGFSRWTFQHISRLSKQNEECYKT